MILEVKDNNGNLHKISISKSLEWTKPYVLKAKTLGVPIWRIKKIKAYYVPENKLEQQHAQIAKSSPTAKYTITLLSQLQIKKTVGNGMFQVDGYADISEGIGFEKTLHSLAHEVSHLVHWDHDCNRLIEEARLFYSFTKLAQKIGYKGYK